MSQFLKLAGWLLCVVYASIPLFWLMIHPRAGYWNSRKRSPYRILLPLWIGIWVLLALLTFSWRRVALYTTPWTWLPAVFLFAAGFWLYSKAGGEFTPAQLSGIAELRPHEHRQQLITTGVRAHLRHPVYLAHLCEILARTGGVLCVDRVCDGDWRRHDSDGRRGTGGKVRRGVRGISQTSARVAAKDIAVNRVKEEAGTPSPSTLNPACDWAGVCGNARTICHHRSATV